VSLTATLPLRYVLITPARNEAEFIKGTIESVVCQTHRPRKWVIVSDGSSDGTDVIVKSYIGEYPWIELVRRPERISRDFAGKVHAFEAGYARLSVVDYDVIGNLDADITFDKDYFAFLLDKFQSDPRLGVGGTPFQEGNHQYDYRFTSIQHVSGACQLFRRECFEAIGGYVPIQGGGIDLVAVTTARMKGWKTRSFEDKVCLHHRSMGTADHSRFRARVRLGVKDYALGSHPLWEVSRCFYQMTKRPFVIGGCAVLGGFAWAAMTRLERPVSMELVTFRRREQLQRLKQFVKDTFSSESGLGDPPLNDER